MAILESVKKLAEKLGAETNGRDITDQLNKINKHLDSAGSSNIAEAVSKFADANSGGSGVGFTKMGIYAIIENEEGDGSAREHITFINNTETSVDVSELRTTSIIVINPVDELKVRPLASVGANYSVSFIPTATCKVYEDETELDLAEIFQSQQTPTGPTVYEPNGLKAHFISGNYSPYAGRVRKLYDTEHDGFDFTLE